MAENDAPERVWIDPDDSSFWDKDNDGDGGGIVEYVRADLAAPDAATCEHGSCCRDKLCFHYCGEHHRSICKVSAPASDLWSDLELVVECVDIPLPQKNSIVAAIRRTQAKFHDAVRQARRETWNSVISKLNERAEDWRLQAERWQKQAENEANEEIRNLSFSDRDACLSKMAALKTFAIEAAALRAEGKELKGD